MGWDKTMKNHVRPMTAGLRDSIDALRRNNKFSHAAILGLVAAIVIGSLSAFAVSFSIDAVAYIEQHGWQNAMERIDDFTTRLWKGRGK